MFYFHECNQAAGESIAEYDAQLRKLVANYNFGATLGDALRDRSHVDYVMTLVRAVFSRRKPSHTKKLWKLHKGWKLLITTPRLSGVQSTLFRSCSCNLPSHSRLAISVITLDIVPALAVSKMLHVMRVEKRPHHSCLPVQAKTPTQTVATIT